MRSGPVLLALLAAGCATPKPQTRLGPEAMHGVGRVAVEMLEAGEFQTPVMRQGAGPAADPGGPIGAAIVEGMKARPVRGSGLAPLVSTEVATPDCRGPLEEAFRDTLLASRRLQVRIAHQEFSDPQLVGFGGLVRIEIEACGFRLLDQDRRILSAFVDLTFRVKTANTRGDGWRSRESFAGNARASLIDLESDPDLVRAEFQQVLAAAGRRLASELLYP